MKILVTGGAGFIGSNLAIDLINEGHTVKVVDNLSTGRIENLQSIIDHPDLEFIEDTVCNKELMSGLVEWCDQCYHLAAPVGVKYIMENLVLTILDNVRGIDVMLELADKFKKRILVASTSEVYGRSLDFLDETGVRKLKETDYRIEGFTGNHRWAYANTKAMDEFLSLAYHKERDLEVIVVRLFNTVGPEQISNYGMVIPNFVERALRNEPIVIYGSGEQKRSFMHVEDSVRAMRGLIETGKGVGGVFNVGNPFEITINELAQKVVEKTGSSAGVKHISYEEAYGKGFEDMQRRTADIGKLEETLGFVIGHDLDSILDDVIEHKRKFVVSASQ